MPIQRTSKPFKDLSFTLGINPLNADLLVLTNENAIARAIRNLVFTYPGERFFQPRLGSEVKRSLFENFDETTLDVIKDEIESTIRSYEPRAKLESTTVSPNDSGSFDSNSVIVVIRYKIIGQDIQPQELSFALEPTR